MKNSLLLVLLAFSFGNSYCQSRQIKVPNGKTVLLDGKIQKNEWSDSRVVFVSDSLTIYFKTDRDYMYVAIKVAEGKNAIVDLYCTRDSNLINLHASAKLGQRVLENENWQDWNWWNNSLWAANVSRVESFEKRTFLKENVREFQVSKAFFRSNNTKLFFEVTFLTPGGTSIEVYPTGANNNRTDNWLTVRWN